MEVVTDNIYDQGWDDPYVPRTHEGLLKWKYADLNSVDFLFEVIFFNLLHMLLNISYSNYHLATSSLLLMHPTNIYLFVFDRLMMNVSFFFFMNVEKRKSWKGLLLHSKVRKIFLFHYTCPTYSVFVSCLNIYNVCLEYQGYI